MDAAPISLYLDTKEGEKPDIETIARTSLALAQAIREAAYIIDPSLEIRIELISGTEGSLSLNSVIKSIKSGDVFTRRNLFAVLTVSLLWFADHAGDWTLDKVLDHVSGQAESAHLSKEDVNDISEKVFLLLEKRVASRHIERCFRELETDPSVKGVGASDRPGEKPKQIVPREEFPYRAGAQSIIETHTEDIKRVRTTIEVLTLVKPVLAYGKKRRWRFSGQEGEFGARIADDGFLQDLLSGNTSVTLAEGINLEVEMQTTDEKINGAWKPTKRVILHIRKIIPPYTQRSFDLRSPKQRQ